MTFRQKLQQRAIKNASPKALKRFAPHDIILAPVLTEKTHGQQEEHKYVFKVHRDANKNDVKSQRKLVRADYKKAIVTLSENEKIEVGV